MVIRALQKVFRKSTYVILASAVSIIVFAFAVWLPNASLIIRVMKLPGVSFFEKLGLPITFLGSIATNFTLLSASNIVLIALLAGINAALMAYVIKAKGTLVGSGLIGASGILASLLGIGCAACGSLILTSLIGTVGGISMLVLLPLHGGEFGIIGAVLLGCSTYLLTKQINNTTCNT